MEPWRKDGRGDALEAAAGEFDVGDYGPTTTRPERAHRRQGQAGVAEVKEGKPSPVHAARLDLAATR
jgi:hypothetical protein